MRKQRYLITNIDEFRELLENHPEEIEVSNAPGSVAYLGMGYLSHMLKQIKKEYPHNKFSFTCNCDDKAMIAYNAITLGFKNIIFTGDKVYLKKLKSIAINAGTKILQS
jgi:hypothetical protein